MIKIVPIYHAEPGVKGGGKYKYYGRITRRKQVDFRHIAETLSQRSTLSTTDMAAAIEGFKVIITEELLNGHNVKLDGLGIFSLSVKTEGVDEPAKLNQQAIKEIKVHFLPDSELKKRLKSAKFNFIHE